MLENSHFAQSVTKFWWGVRKLDCVAANTVQLVLCTFCNCPSLAVSRVQITGKQAAFSYTRVFNKVLQICISAEKVDFCRERIAHPASLSVIPTKCIVMSSNWVFNPTKPLLPPKLALAAFSDNSLHSINISLHSTWWRRFFWNKFCQRWEKSYISLKYSSLVEDVQSNRE